MSAVDCFQISKSFLLRKKTVHALEDVTLAVEEGEFIILTGPGGSGKSTLLSILGGQIAPDGGESYILGQSIHRMTNKKKNQFRLQTIGYVFKEPSLISGLSVEENVLIPLQFSRQNQKDRVAQVTRVLEKLGLEEKGESYPEELSVQDRHLVALARALVTDPQVLLLDEPTRFMDHPTGVKAFTMLMQLALDQHVTIISATNDLRLHPFAHRIVKMRQGKIEEVLGESSEEEIPPFLRL